MTDALQRPLALGWSLLLSQELAKSQPPTAQALEALERELQERVREATQSLQEPVSPGGWSLEELQEQHALGAVMDLVIQHLPNAAPSAKPVMEAGSWSVLVDDNFDPESKAYTDSQHLDPQTAVARCKSIVDACLRESFQPGMQANALYELYRLFGDDPFIVGSGAPEFSAWDYARQRCDEMCAQQGGQQ